MSFKAKIIEGPEYYRLRRKILLIGFLPTAALLFTSLMYDTWRWIAVPLSILLIIEIFVAKKLGVKFTSLIGNQNLVIEKEHIQIFSKKKLIHNYPVSELDSIEVNTNFGMTHETQKELYGDIVKGQSVKHSIVLTYGDKKTNYYFEFDSYYMIEQLKKVVGHWKTKGVNVILSNTPG